MLLWLAVACSNAAVALVGYIVGRDAGRWPSGARQHNVHIQIKGEQVVKAVRRR